MVSKLMFMEIFEPEKSKVQKKKILSIKSEIVVFLHISAFRILTFSPALAESSAAQTFYCSLTASLLKFFWLVYVESKRMKTPIYSYSLEIVSFTYKNLFVIYTLYSKRRWKNCNKSMRCIYKYLFYSHKCQWIHDNLIEKSLHFQQSKCDLNRTKYNLRRYILYTKLLHSIKWWRCYLLTGLIHFLAYGLLFLKKSHTVFFFGHRKDDIENNFLNP